ncbi:MAG TPA: protein TolR [Burkholderiales bacterium]|nr:protein TolR [Burkholderiales bacterium]
MSRSRQRKVMSQINVVPYIDVMLVLLVIFMVTAPLLNPTIVDLPSVGKSSMPPTDPPLEVVIKADSSMLLRDRGAGKTTERPVEMRALVQAVKDKQVNAPDRAVVISADKDVRYETVMKVMDELQKQQVKRVGLMVKPAA